MSVEKIEVQPAPRGITLRSLLFGFLGALIMAGIAGYHDSRFGHPLMVGNHMPGGAFTYIIFVALIWNGLAGRLRKSLALNPRELGVVFIMTLIACYPPTSGLFRYFHRLLTLPWYYLPGRPEWIEHGVLTNINPRLFPKPAPWLDNGVLVLDEEVYRGMFTGLAQGTKVLGLAELPLRAWLGSLAYWGPLVFLLALCVIALQFLVHRQWAHHEQLSYPIAQVAGSLCARSDNQRGVPDLFRKRLFWWGMVPVFSLYLLEYLGIKYPLSIPLLKEFLPNLKSWHLPLMGKMPFLKHSTNWWCLTSQSIFFSIVGLAFFVSSEISLTMALAPTLMVAMSLFVYFTFGTPVTGQDLEAGRAGAFLGYTLILLYTGRTYFRSVLARAFLGRGQTKPGDPAVLAARVLLLAFVAFVVVLRLMGCDLIAGIFFGLLTLMLLFVLTRIICETGIPFVQAGWMPGRLLVSLFGPAAIGPGTLTLLMWVNVVLVQDPRESLMPYVATGVKVADENGLKLKRVFWLITGTVALALVIAFFSSSYTLYNFNAMGDGFASNYAVVDPFDQVAKMIGELKDTRLYDESLQAGALGKLALIRTNLPELRFFGAGLVAVALVALLRFRFARFPIHPVLFLVWGTYPSSSTWASFMLGWFIKTLVVRFGGGGTYQRLKPFFIGLISAELLAVGLHIVANIVYNSIFGEPSQVRVFILPN